MYCYIVLCCIVYVYRGFGLGGQGSWAGPAWLWLGGPRVLGRTGLGLAWEAKGPGPGRLGSEYLEGP